METLQLYLAKNKIINKKRADDDCRRIGIDQFWCAVVFKGTPSRLVIVYKISELVEVVILA